jgi:hypothetical protein
MMKHRKRARSNAEETEVMQEVLDKASAGPWSTSFKHAMMKISIRNLVVNVQKDFRSVLEYTSLQIDTCLKALSLLSMREAIVKLTTVEDSL